jgi:hypothetical protein
MSDELFGDLPAEERARLERAGDLMRAAGPLPELPPELEEPVAPPAADIIEYPTYPKRGYAAASIAAAAVVLASFGVGYLLGHRNTGGGKFIAVRTVRMHSTNAAPQAIASLQIGSKDAAGNWPMLVNVSNLPKLPRRGYYTLWLTRKGKPVVACGTFLAQGARTKMQFTVAYPLKRFDGWVVTKQLPGHHEAGVTVLTT